jgi:hypothetical protein
MATFEPLSFDFSERIQEPRDNERTLLPGKSQFYPFKDEAQTALFKDPVRTAL